MDSDDVVRRGSQHRRLAVELGRRSVLVPRCTSSTAYAGTDLEVGGYAGTEVRRADRGHGVRTTRRRQQVCSAGYLLRQASAEDVTGTARVTRGRGDPRYGDRGSTRLEAQRTVGTKRHDDASSESKKSDAVRDRQAAAPSPTSSAGFAPPAAAWQNAFRPASATARPLRPSPASSGTPGTPKAFRGLPRPRLRRPAGCVSFRARAQLHVLRVQRRDRTGLRPRAADLCRGRRDDHQHRQTGRDGGRAGQCRWSPCTRPAAPARAQGLHQGGPDTRRLDAGRELRLDARDLSCWHPGHHDWVLGSGAGTIQVGAYSTDLRAAVDLDITGDRRPEPLTAWSTLREALAHPAAGPVVLDAITADPAAGLHPHVLEMCLDLPLRVISGFNGFDGFAIEPDELPTFLDTANDVPTT